MVFIIYYRPIEAKAHFDQKNKGTQNFFVYSHIEPIHLDNQRWTFSAVGGGYGSPTGKKNFFYNIFCFGHPQ